MTDSWFARRFPRSDRPMRSTSSPTDGDYPVVSGDTERAYLEETTRKRSFSSVYRVGLLQHGRCIEERDEGA